MRKVIFIICALLLGWMIWQAGIAQLWHYLLSWNWILLGCVLVWGIGYLLNTVSFLQIIHCYQHPSLKTREVVRMGGVLTIAGYALNYITPFGLLGGEPWRIHQLRQIMKPQDANSAVAYYAMLHIGSHILFWLLGAAYALWSVSFLMQQYWWQFTLGMIGVLLLLIVIYNICTRKGWIEHLQSLMAAHPKQFWSALLLELVSRMVNVFEYWLLLSAAFPDSTLSSYGAAYLVVAFSSLFANMLFFSPLQMGTREGGILLILLALLPEAQSNMDSVLPVAVSISFATRIREFVWIGIGLLLMQVGISPKQEKIC